MIATASMASKLKARLAVAAGELVAGFTNMNRTTANTNSAITVRTSLAVTGISFMCETLDCNLIPTAALFFCERVGPFGFWANLLVFVFLGKRITHVRKICFCLAVVMLSAAVFAQDDPAIKHPNWNLGLFAIGGTGLSQDTDVHMFGVGARLGRVLTNEHGGGVLRGNLEWNAEVLPFYQFYSPRETATGTVVNPLVLKYNFTHGKKLMPFFEAVGGAIFTNKNFPPGDTAQINFNSGAGVGFHLFTRSNRSVTFDVRALHISNASIGNHNPGVNASLQFTLGYTWWK